VSFLVLDGVDGCGKSTQAARLVARLQAQGRVVRHLREPGSTAVGEALRSLLLDTRVDLHPQVEVLLFAAARRQLLAEEVAPALAGGEVVVCERYNSSTFAYQAVAGGLDAEAVLELLREWVSPVEPALVVVLDVDPHQAAARRQGEAQDRIEAKGLEFQERVAEGYRRFVEIHDHAVLVDATGEADEVEQRVWEEVDRAL
jgi:dTMP kinase